MSDVELDQAFFKAGTSFDRPMPGESLTRDPDDRLPFEQPPKFTDRNDALEYHFELFTEEDNYAGIMEALESGVSIMEVVQVFLMQGFRDGLYNPDMMLMLAEPLAYMIAALAERAEVEFTIMNDPDEMPTVEEAELPIMNQAMRTIEKPEMDEDFPADLAGRLAKLFEYVDPFILGFAFAQGTRPSGHNMGSFNYPIAFLFALAVMRVLFSCRCLPTTRSPHFNDGYNLPRKGDGRTGCRLKIPL